ncbi:hypothetical protein ACFE04_014857 [Oxalis oulophora]
MGTEVLRPHDCLTERIRTPSSSVYHSRRKINYYSQGYVNNYNFTPKPNRKQPVVRSPDQCRKPRDNATTSRRSLSTNDLKFSRNRVAGAGDHFPVTILRRGESLEMKIEKKSAGKSDILYAGSAFAVSPAPSSLPLPSFSKRISVDDSATRDLRRLLRLDL